MMTHRQLRILVAAIFAQQHGAHNEHALSDADALLAAAGEQEREPDDGGWHRVASRQADKIADLHFALDNAERRAEAAEARAAELQAKLDEAARLARETAGEAMEAVRADTPVVVIPEGDWRRLVELTSRGFPSYRCADDDCDACREDDELKAIIERTEAANG